MQDRGHYIFVSCSSNLYLDQSISLQKEKDISCRSFELVRLKFGVTSSKSPALRDSSRDGGAAQLSVSCVAAHTASVSGGGVLT